MLTSTKKPKSELTLNLKQKNINDSTTEISHDIIQKINNSTFINDNSTTNMIPNQVTSYLIGIDEENNPIKAKCILKKQNRKIAPGKISTSTIEQFDDVENIKTHNRFCRNIEIMIIIAYYLVLMALIILDELYISNLYKTNEILTAIKSLIYIQLIINIYFLIDFGIKYFILYLKEIMNDKLGYLNLITKFLAFILTIIELILIHQDDINVKHTPIIRGFSRICMINILIPHVNLHNTLQTNNKRDYDLIKNSRVDIIDYDYTALITKILEILESAKTFITDEMILAQYNWVLKMIISNKLYESILEVNEKKNKENDLDIKNCVTKYALGLREELSPPNNINDSNVIIIEESTNKPKDEVLSIPPTTIELFDKHLHKLSFNIFEIKNITKGNELPYILYYIFDKTELFTILNINRETFCQFARKVKFGYHSNPYHNCTHAADVIQTLYYFMKECKLIEYCELTSLEQAAIYIAGAIHDYDHPGTNNTYHINTRSIYALRYNDKSVLENHHISSSWQMIIQENQNIFKNFSKENLTKIRERLISMVLATDMTSHFTELAKIKGRLTATDFDLKLKDKNSCMDFVVHAADISNPAKPFELCKEWAIRILNELWNQGDLERSSGLPLTYLCDRYTVNTAKSQIGFIDFMAQPTYEVLSQIIPKLDLTNFEKNKAQWRNLIEDYDRLLGITTISFMDECQPDLYLSRIK